jgi:ABC-2 type transport system permease protein
VIGQLWRLKARLTWNGLRADWQRRVGMPAVLLLMVMISRHVASRFLSTHAGLQGPPAGEMLLWAALIFWAVWVALPVVIFPLDENLDPARFATLPISSPRLIGGLGLSALVSPSAVVAVVLLVVNLSRFPPTLWPLGIVVSLVLLAQLVTASQLFTGAVSAMLRSRRGRDLAVFLVIGVGLFFFGAYQLIEGIVIRHGLSDALTAHPLSGWAWLLPPVASQRVMVDAAAGQWGTALFFLLVAVGWVGVLASTWSKLTRWMLTTPDSSPRPSRARRSQGLAGRGPWGVRRVVARKELRFYFRDPRQRLVWTGTVIFVGLAIAALVVGSEGIASFRQSEWLPLLAPAMVLFVGLPISLNQFGWERNAASYLFALPIRPRALLQGKNLASTAAMLVETVFLALLLAWVSDSWGLIHLVPGLTAAAIGCQLAVGNLVSVITPLRLPREGTDVFAQTTEQGCLAIAAQALAFFLIGILLVPPASAAVLTIGFGEVLSPSITTAIAVVWGAGMYLMSMWVAGVLLKRRVPEIVNWVQVY